ncbi:MAG: RNA polymerase sigma factor [Ktedonobacteraceae bacterium]
MLQPMGDNFTNSEPSAHVKVITALVARARKGDKAAFEELYCYYSKPIWNRLIRLVGNREDAEELHQETFFRAWTKLPKQKHNLQFGPWLYRIAVNLAIDNLRRRKIIEFLSLQEEESEGLNSLDCLRVTGLEEGVCERDYFKKALERVSPRFRICLLLQDQWGFSQFEISKLLQITVGCVSSYTIRGREQFRQAYHHLESESDGSAQGDQL